MKSADAQKFRSLLATKGHLVPEQVLQVPSRDFSWERWSYNWMGIQYTNKHGEIEIIIWAVADETGQVYAGIIGGRAYTFEPHEYGSIATVLLTQWRLMRS